MEQRKLTNLPKKYTFDDVLLKPQNSNVEPDETRLHSHFSKHVKLETPFISSPMDTVTGPKLCKALAELGGIGVLHRNQPIAKEVKQAKLVKAEGYKVAGAVGPFEHKRVDSLDPFVDAIVIDCAHGHNQNVIESAEWMQEQIDSDLVVGNIATAQAVKDYLKRFKPDGFRVGVGPGSICTTRIKTGIGYPQLSAIEETNWEARKADVPLIADGGMEKGGDAVKALVAGADSLMFGNLFAGTYESPTKVIDGAQFNRDGKYKPYRGMGSETVTQRITDRYLKSQKGVPEGVEGLVPLRGSVKDIVTELKWAIKQGMGYIGAENVQELKEKGEFVAVSHQTMKQSSPSVTTISPEAWKEKIKK